MTNEKSLLLLVVLGEGELKRDTFGTEITTALTIRVWSFSILTLSRSEE
jgi:hypothetical protein